MTKKEKTFKEVLAEIESPQDWGNGSWSLTGKCYFFGESQIWTL